MSNDTELICGMLFCLCSILEDCSRTPTQKSISETQTKINVDSVQPPTTTILNTETKEKYTPPSHLPPVIL